MKRSARRFTLIASVLPPTMASVTQMMTCQLGQPRAASTIAMYAKGRAKTVCSNLIASRKWRSAFNRMWRGLQPVLGPAPAHERAGLVAHDDLLRPRLTDAVRIRLLGRVDAELAAEAMTERR